MIARKKILLLLCGGTALFPEKAPFKAVHKKEDVDPWMKNIEELKMIADIEPYFIYGGEAADVGSREWIRLAETIFKNYRKYDGFVITHGMETLSYTAAVLSFMLQRLGKPVVITGSPIPSKEEDSAEVLESMFKNFKGLGVKANLINACQVALSDISGVVMIFGSRILSGNQLEKVPATSLNFLEAYNNRVIGKVDFGLTLYDPKLKRHGQKPVLRAKIDPRISTFDFHPGVDLGIFENVLKQQSHGLIIKTQSTSFFPEKIYALLKKAQKKLPVVIYSTGGFKRVGEDDFIYVDNMGYFTTVVKLMWALGQTRNLKAIRRMMATDYTGEMIKREAPK